MKNLLIITLLLFGCLTANAKFSLMINDPQKSWVKEQGYISDPTVVVTPKGMFAQVEFTFKMHCQNSFNATDTLEAVLEFDLPSNSFIHNSWLWLDNNTIIEADIIDRGRAIQVYESIVNRRRDPSLLIKTGANSYKLNVFPLTTTYPRQVKIVYSIPFYLNGNRANIQLPTDILNASLVPPSLNLIVKSNDMFTQPFFTDHPFNSYVTSTGINMQTLMLPGSSYDGKDVTLNYHTGFSGGVYLNTYPTGANSGIYQLAIDPAEVTGQVVPKSVVFILDHQNSLSSQNMHSFSEIKDIVKSYLLNRANPTDSFNIFYVDHTNTLVQASTSWMASDSANVHAAINSIPTTINSNSPAKYEQLLKEGLAFAKTKPGNYTQSILISNSNNMQSQAIADSAFNRISAYVGGFANKTQVISTSRGYSWVNGTMVKANLLLYSQLTLSSGGNYYGPIQNSGNTYDLDTRNILNDMYRQLGTNIAAYNIDLPIAGGFSFTRYDITGLNRFSTSLPYVETGVYTGTLTAGNVDVQLLTGSGVITAQLTVQAVENATSHNRQVWANQYIKDLLTTNVSNVYTTEIIDSSISNRVLCDLTAFLALETGDTVQSSANEHGPGSGGGSTGIEEEQINKTVKCYPNPFTSEITIEFTKTVTELLIFDITGRLVFTVKPSSTDRKFLWNGRTSAGAAVPAGIYIIKARTADGLETYKVMKQ